MSSALANLRLHRREAFSAYAAGINEKQLDDGAISTQKVFRDPDMQVFSP
jgi:hypothetical protein